MPKCERCGKQIIFINPAREKAIAVNPSPVYFLPGLGNESFITKNGIAQGKPAFDGRKGYKVHICN